LGFPNCLAIIIIINCTPAIMWRRGQERKRSGNLFSCAVTVFWDFSLFPLAYDVVWSASCGGRSVFS
jgi:hypothetical protein